MKKLLIVLLVVVLVGLLSACGGDGSEGPAVMGAVSTPEPAVGETLVGEAIDGFFDNSDSCGGIVCSE